MGLIVAGAVSTGGLATFAMKVARKRTVRQKTFRTHQIKGAVKMSSNNIAMKTPPIVSPPEWEAARHQLLVKEKDLTHARDALAAERRRMAWLAIEKKYQFDGPTGKASLLDLFEGRRQLIVCRPFFELGVFG